MVTNNCTWLKDRFGHTVTYDKLPDSLQKMDDDPYRTLSEWLKDSHGYIMCTGDDGTQSLPQCKTQGEIYFLQMIWDEVIKERFPVPGIYDTIGSAQVGKLRGILNSTMSYALSSDAKQYPGWNQAQAIQKPQVVSPDVVSGCYEKPIWP